MQNDVAIYLDLDNLVIGSKQANIVFDIHPVLAHVKEITKGRIVLQRAYGEQLNDKGLLRQLARVGFIIQSSVRLNISTKNLADMQIVVDAMETLVNGRSYNTYVLMTGDRDFTPLAQSLRKFGKIVIGIGVKHTTSKTLINQCDYYIYYEDLLPPVVQIEASNVEELLATALDQLLKEKTQVRASVLKQRMHELTKGAFDHRQHVPGSFRKFLDAFPHRVAIKQDETTVYVQRPLTPHKEDPLHLRYQRSLKKQNLRVLPASIRFRVLGAIITVVQQEPQIPWRDLANKVVSQTESQKGDSISKSAVNDILSLVRRARVIHVGKGRSFSTAPVTLQINGEKPFQKAVVECDKLYLKSIKALNEPFDIEAAAIALYGKPQYTHHLKQILGE